MAASPDNARQRHEEALAAAALLLGKRYDLPALIRAARVKPRPFRRIEPTSALRYGMARPYLTIVRAWEAQRPALLAAYAEALRTGETAIITRAVAAAERAVGQAVTAQAREVRTAIAQLERWHRAQWISRVKSATQLDVTALTLPGDVGQPAGAAVAWNEQLLSDVHREMSAGVAAALLAAAAIRAPAATARARVGAVTKKSRKRALRIGVDQVDRTVPDFDRSRREAAGLTAFIWHHSPHVAHPRPEHVARDGRIYTQRNAPNDRAGVLFGCQCWEEPLFD